MDKEKYGSMEVFDLSFCSLDKDEDGVNPLLFEIDSATEVTLHSYIDHGAVTVTDALINVKLLNDIQTGRYDERLIMMFGESTLRNAESGDDELAVLKISEVELTKHSVQFCCNERALAKLTFRYDKMIENGKDNFKMTLIKKEKE